MRMPGAAALIVIGCTVPADAQYALQWWNGNDIQEMCTREFGIELGYSVAVAEAAARNRGVCIPVGVPAEQLRDVICRHLADNPQSRQKGAYELTYLQSQKLGPVPDKPE